MKLGVDYRQAGLLDKPLARFRWALLPAARLAASHNQIIHARCNCWARLSWKNFGRQRRSRLAPLAPGIHFVIVYPAGKAAHSGEESLHPRLQG